MGILLDAETGDDDQVGTSYSVTFRHASSPGAFITRTAYPVGLDDDKAGPFFVRVEIARMLCRDAEDRGGTESWSDPRTETEPEPYGTAEEAELAARSLAAEMLADAGSLTWDELPW
jgi:hypothetical protein